MYEKTQKLSFEEVHLHLKGMIEQYACFLLQRRQYVEDTSQDLFEMIWCRWDRLSELPKEDLNAYVYRMTRNYIFNQRKRERRQQKQLNGFVYSQSLFTWHDQTLFNEGMRFYQQAIDRLPSKQRMVYLYYGNDLNRVEIGALIQRSANTVNNQLRSAGQSIKRFLNKNLDLHLNEDGRKRHFGFPVSLN